jgi:hypothetical protein
MKGTTQHKKRVTNSHNREFISLGASSLFLFEATMIWQSEITPCNMWADGECVYKMMILASIYRYDLCPMGRQMAIGRKFPFLHLLCQSFISSFERFHHDDYLFMFLQTLSFAFFCPVVRMCLRLWPKNTFPNIDCLSLFKPAGVLMGKMEIK